MTTATTKNAPARSGNSGEGMDRTTNQQKEGTVMGIIPDQADRTKEPGTCPSWCAKHVTDPDFGVVHQRLVTVRDMTVSVELGSEGPAIFIPETLEITPSQAVRLAAALVGALALLEDVDQ